MVSAVVEELWEHGEGQATQCPQGSGKASLGRCHLDLRDEGPCAGQRSEG